MFQAGSARRLTTEHFFVYEKYIFVYACAAVRCLWPGASTPCFTPSGEVTRPLQRK